MKRRRSHQSNQRSSKALLLAGSFALAVWGGASEAQTKPQTKPSAQETIQCSIRSILGQEKPGGIDKQLKSLKKQFSHPPFSAFKTLQLLETKSLAIPQGETKQTQLPTGKILKLTFKEKLLEAKNKLRLRLHLSITPPKTARFLPGTVFTIDNRGTLLVAGEKYKGGTLVVGVTCKAK